MTKGRDAHMSASRRGRTRALQLLAARGAEPHLRHLGLEQTPVSPEIHWDGQEVPTVGPWAPSQWVNPVQHEG